MNGAGDAVPPEVGRDALATDLARRLVGPARRSVVLSGPAGIGKTHLAEAVLDELDRLDPADRPATRRVAGGVALQHLEFGALLHLLDVDDPPVTTEFELVQRIRRALVEQATPTVLRVDDAGLLDVKSAGIIEGLLRSKDVVVVATERTSSGDRGDPHHLSSVLADEADAVVVPPLPSSEASDLITELLGRGEVGSQRSLVALGQGNPLALRALVASAAASGSVRHRDGLWHLRDFVVAGASLEQLVDSHLARLDAAEWDLLRTMVIARSVPRAVLARLDVSALERLERAGLAGGDPSEVLHPLYAGVIRERLQGEETRRLCAKLASAVGPSDGVDPARLARWLFESGAEIDDATARRGAAAAIGRWENRLARDLIDRITEPTVADLVQAQWAHANDGDLDGAVRLSSDAVAAAVTDAERVDTGLARAELFILQLGRAEEAYEWLDRLRETLEQPDQRARVDGATAMYMRMTGRGSLAEARTEAAMAEGSDSDEARLSILLADAFGKLFTGELHAAEPVVIEAYEVAARRGEPHNEVRISIVDALRRLLLGRLDLADELIERALRAADVSAVRPAHAAWLGLAAQSAAMRGDIESALRRSNEAVHAASHVDDMGSGGFVRGERRAMRLEAGIAAAEDPSASPLGRSRALVRALDADDADVDALALELSQSAVDAGYVLWAPWIAMEAVRRGSAPASSRFVAHVAGPLDGPLYAAFVDHAVGSDERDIERVDGAADVFAGLGAAALAFDARLTALELGLARSDTDDDDALVTLRRRVLAMRVPASAPPRLSARVAAVAERIAMPTERQLEIATLVADGRSSKEVAALLVVSARTVDNHLAAIYRKFGVSGRADLSELF